MAEGYIPLISELIKFIAEWRELYPTCGTGTTHTKVREVTGTRDTA
jgi:hypothetical protein